MIVKRRRNRDFTVVNNAVLNDDRLSLDAMGLQAWLLSKPNDWTLNFEHLRKRFSIGRDKAYKLVNELVEAGWIVKEWHRDGGSYAKIEYMILDEPREAAPFTEKPETVKAEPAVTQAKSESAEVSEPFPGLPFPAEPYPEKPYPENQDAIVSTEPLLSTEREQNLPNPSPGEGLSSSSKIEGAPRPEPERLPEPQPAAHARPAEPECDTRRRRRRRDEPEPAKPVIPVVFVHAGSPEAEAWEASYRAQGKRGPVWFQCRDGFGRHMLTQWPPGHVPRAPPDPARARP